MSTKVSVFGSINMDQVARVDRFPEPGETLKGKEFFSVPGGKGANQAVAASRLGAEVSLFGLVGRDVFGDELLSELKSNGINTDYVEKRQCSTGLALIQVDDSGENKIVIIPGANGEVDENYVDNSFESILDTDVLLLQLEIPISTIEYLLGRLSSEGKRTPDVILDPAPAHDLSGLDLTPVDYLIPKEGELKRILSVEDESDIETNLLERGIRALIVTKGEKGSSFISKGNKFTVPPFSINVVDTTAAGDAFAGALAVGLAEGKDIRNTIEFANAAGSLAAASSGAQPSLPDLVSVTEFLKERSHGDV